MEKRRRRERDAEAAGVDTTARGTAENRRGSRSFSEEEITVGETSRRCCRRRHRHCCRHLRRRHPRRSGYETRADCDRRAKSESSRYEEKRREYGESWSDADEYSTEERKEEKEEKEKKCSRTRVPGAGAKKSRDEMCDSTDDGTDTDDESVSDDSLEVVVVVKKSLEKTSEKIQISGNKSKTPRETSRETRVREETRRSRRRRRSKGGRVESVERVGAETVPERGPTQERIVERSNEEKERKLVGEDATDSTSPETVERVTVTALVHKDEAPDTPEEQEKHVDTPAAPSTAETEEESSRAETEAERRETTEAETPEPSRSSPIKEEPEPPSPRMSQERSLEQTPDESAIEVAQGTPTTATTTSPRSDEEKHEIKEDDGSGSHRSSSEAEEQSEEKATVLKSEESTIVEPKKIESSSVDQEAPSMPGTGEPVGEDGEKSTDELEKTADTKLDETRESESAYNSTDAKLSSPGNDSAKSSRSESRSRPSTGKKMSSVEGPPDSSAIVAVIESPEWDDEEVEKEIERVVEAAAADESVDRETDAEDSPRVFRVLRSASEDQEEEEESPGSLSSPRKSSRASKSKDSIPQPLHAAGQRRVGSQARSGGSADSEVRGGGRGKQRRDSAGRDSGIEPSPRVSKIPTRTTKPRYCPNTDKQRALNMETITRDVQISLRRYHLERKIFFQLMELKRLQIRHGRANEHVLVKRQVRFH